MILILSNFEFDALSKCNGMDGLISDEDMPRWAFLMFQRNGHLIEKSIIGYEGSL